jgi:hypothetical protein
VLPEFRGILPANQSSEEWNRSLAISPELEIELGEQKRQEDLLMGPLDLLATFTLSRAMELRHIEKWVPQNWNFSEATRLVEADHAIATMVNVLTKNYSAKAATKIRNLGLLREYVRRHCLATQD